MNKKLKQYPAEEVKALKRMYWRSNFLEACFTMTTLQGLGFGYSILPMLKYYYKDDDAGLKAALKRHTQFFNTTPNVATFNLGVAAAMEKEAAVNADFDPTSINAVKTALLGPTAGIGDAIFWVVLRTLAAGIGISLAQSGSILGAIVFVLMINVPSFIGRWYLEIIAYTTSTSMVKKMDESGLITIISESASIIGLTMVGAMVASNVALTTPLTLTFGDVPFELQSAFDSIMPGFLPLMLSFLVMYLLRKKIKANWIILALMILSIIGKYAGVL